ncbi:enoyl-CoA hydratase-related protein [Leptospira alstonii]|uniref:Enoyl-CoA hydratase/isomerase family protein n=2 Tax=Leptospira alstonii TaxID=28452 RepID=M6D5Z0_9LEPT|nr:enoyl-CoA hydratase-related protein [Leptospira alstonii]EMJ98076.1 enoyl-CoA hydratase/isomerase family protein [Leptospira alstonii serovar Sichuan str. 79601]EQA81089.1 enoyl-CoA hydratase/isomerase family protein [Leptospira alstonii serovar Pingchang str. 80-412]
MIESSTVSYSTEQEIAVLLLNRPEKRNAISKELLSTLHGNILKAKKEKSIRALVLGGIGPSFCAGADLKERTTMSAKEVKRFLQDLKNCFLELENFPYPTIAALDGDAFGGGLELALCCDFILLKNDIRIGLTETRLGIIPGAGGTQRLPRRIGIAKAKEMIFTGKTIDAQTALSYGLANSIWHDSSLPAAKMLAEEMTSHCAPIALQLAKKAIAEGYGQDIRKALKTESKYYDETLKTEDRSEALKAFQEKRKPIFKGR